MIWKTDLPGRGWSSPVVAEGTVWVTTAIEETPTDEERQRLLEQSNSDPKQAKSKQVAKRIRLQALAVDQATGKLLQSVELFVVEKPDPIHSLNSYASPTPVIDGKNLYCHFGTFGTACINREQSEVVWQRRLPLRHEVGPGSSPVVHDNRLILICDGVDRQYVTALDKMTGKTLWEVERPEMDAPDGDQKKSYCTPIVVTDSNGRTQIICMGSQWLVSYEPATGRELWKFRHGKGFSVVPRPVSDGDTIYISTGYGKPVMVAVRITGSGNVTESALVWTEVSGIPAKPRHYSLTDGCT